MSRQAGRRAGADRAPRLRARVALPKNGESTGNP
jgi:hypothetical protein